MKAAPTYARRWLVCAYLLVVLISTWQRGIETREHTTFAIFRQSYVHLVEHRDLYAMYPAEQGAASDDLFKYSPTAAVLFAPLSAFSYPVGLLLWNLVNAGALFWAVTRLLPRKQADMALFILLPEVFTAIQASSSNALIAALMLLGFRWIGNGRYGRAAFALGVGTAIKIFPLAMAGVACMRRGRWPFIRAFVVAGIVLLLLPLLVVPFADVLYQYHSWRGLEMMDAADVAFGMSFIRALRDFWATSLPNWAFQLAGTAMVLTPLLRRDRWDDRQFRIGVGCSILLFAVLFNHQAERQSLVIGAAGCVVWMVTSPLSWPLVICYVLALTGYSVLPYAVFWLILQHELLGDLPARAWASLRRQVAILSAPSSNTTCRSCRTHIPHARFTCPDCQSVVMTWLSYGTPQFVVRMLLILALCDEVTLGHYFFSWNLWDLVR